VGIKDDMGYVKGELSGDEKVLESVLKIETLYNKHKRKIWTILAVIVLFFVGKVILDTVHEAKLESANDALVVLKKNPKDSGALEKLKSKNPVLYELYRYQQAVIHRDAKVLEALSKSEDPLISDISEYSNSVLASKSSDSVYYKEMSLIEDAYLALKAGKRQEAKEKLELIDPRSPLAQVADLLKHYTIKGK